MENNKRQAKPMKDCTTDKKGKTGKKLYKN
jgi:hypothetical protein